MLKNKSILSIFILIVAVVLIFIFAFFSRPYWQKAKNENRNINAAANTPSANVPDQNTENTSEASRMFRLVRGQAVQAAELDLRLVVLDYVFVPCQENASCRFRQFRAEIAASSISDPSKSERVFFGNFPAQTYALGKIFQVVNADEESFQLFVRQASDTENTEADKAAGDEIKFEIDAGEAPSTNSQ